MKNLFLLLSIEVPKTASTLSKPNQQTSHQQLITIKKRSKLNVRHQKDEGTLFGKGLKSDEKCVKILLQMPLTFIFLSS